MSCKLALTHRILLNWLVRHKVDDDKVIKGKGVQLLTFEKLSIRLRCRFHG